MGVGHVDAVDPDLVEDSNRNRQDFVVEDVGRPKTHRLLHRIRPYATRPMHLRGFFMTFEELVATRRLPKYSGICCGVDRRLTMVEVSRYGLRTTTPVVFVNVSEDGEGARIFIQRPGAACFACYDPSAVTADDGRRGCSPVPAIADILHVAVGFATRALVGEVMGAQIGEYNARDVTMSGIDIKQCVSRKTECQLCGAPEREA